SVSNKSTNIVLTSLVSSLPISTIPKLQFPFTVVSFQIGLVSINSFSKKATASPTAS
ncbi:MAG: hypothetical protein ACI9XB_001741, partial [Gammaproteobacteria bacterium]